MCNCPAEISFHNRLAVRIGFIAAMGAVMISVFPIPLPFVRLPIAFLAAGFLAVYLYSRRTGQTLSIRSGARMGWITGIFSFTLVTVLFTVAMVAISSQGGLVKQLLSQLPANDARADVIQQALSNPALIARSGGALFDAVLRRVYGSAHHRRRAGRQGSREGMICAVMRSAASRS